MKICVVVTARPSYSRLRSLLFALKDAPDVELQIVVGCSALLERYGNVSRILEADGFTISDRVWATVEGETLHTSALGVSVALAAFANTFARLEPDVVVIHADRHELLAPASAARLLEIEIAHCQGGEVTGSVDDTVRNALTQMATYHLVSTAQAARRVIAMRLSNLGGGISITGCPSIDLCVGLEDDAPVTADELGGAGKPIDLTHPFLVLLQHPTTDRAAHAYDEMAATLAGCTSTGLPVLALWPGNEAGMDGASKALREAQPFIHTVRNLPPRRFLKLLTQCAVLVGNSSCGLREASFLGVPAVNIGTRQKHRERGPNVLDVPRFEPWGIAQAIGQQVRAGFYPSSTLYGDGQSGPRMASVLREVMRERGPYVGDPACAGRGRW